MRKPSTRVVAAATFIVAIGCAAGLVGTGIAIGRSSAETVAAGPDPITAGCRDAAERMYGLTYRILGEVIAPITFHGAAADTITDDLDAIMDAHEDIYWTSMRDCAGEPRPEFVR